MTTVPSDDQAPDLSGPNRLLTPEEIEECEQMRLRILADCDQILVAGRHGQWQQELRSRFGDEIGELLAAQEVRIGMTLEQLTASFGPADQVEIVGPITTYTYGSKAKGSYFDVRAGMIEAAFIRGRPLPPVALGE